MGESVLNVLDTTIQLACDGYILEHHEVVDLERAREAISNLMDMAPPLLAMYRKKWGNKDDGANTVLENFESALRRVGGA